MDTLLDRDGASLADRAGKYGTLVCADMGTSRCATGGGRYSLKVAPARRPNGAQKLLRALWPVILPFE